MSEAIDAFFCGVQTLALVLQVPAESTTRPRHKCYKVGRSVQRACVISDQPFVVAFRSRCAGESNKQTGFRVTVDSQPNQKACSNTSVMNRQRIPNCARCSNHNKRQAVKRYCRFRTCSCKKCEQTAERQRIMAQQVAARRALAQDLERANKLEDQQHQEETPPPPPPPPNAVPKVEVAQDPLPTVVTSTAQLRPSPPLPQQQQLSGPSSSKSAPQQARLEPVNLSRPRWDLGAPGLSTLSLAPAQQQHHHHLPFLASDLGFSAADRVTSAGLNYFHHLQQQRAALMRTSAVEPIKNAAAGIMSESSKRELIELYQHLGLPTSALSLLVYIFIKAGQNPNEAMRKILQGREELLRSFSHLELAHLQTHYIMSSAATAAPLPLPGTLRPQY